MDKPKVRADGAQTAGGQSVPAASATGDDVRPDRYAWKAVWASTVGYALDGFDFLILGFALSAIAASLALTPAEAGSLATLTLFGAVVGGIVFGVLSDYFGRVRLLALTIVIFAVFTGLTALSQDYWQIAVFRFLAGVGLGGEFGIGMTLAAEAWPARLRARATSLVAVGWQTGVLLAAVAATALLPVIGWRGLFVVGVLPALFAFVVRRSVHEPALFEEQKSRTRQNFPLRLLVKDAATTKTSLGITILTSVQNFGYYGLIIWLPTYLATQFGYSLTKTGAWTAVTVIGMIIGIMVFGVLADHFGRRPLFYAFQVGAAVSVVVYSQLTGSIALLIGGAVLGFFVNGMLGGYGALMAELYPTEARATAQNVLFNIGRAVGGFGPLVVGGLAAVYGFSLVIALLAVIYVIDLIATALLIPERRGAPLM
jgi:MFS family permease